MKLDTTVKELAIRKKENEDTQIRHIVALGSEFHSYGGHPEWPFLEPVCFTLSEACQ
jgi:hypothetical protein